MSNPFQGLSEEELIKVGDTAGRLAVGKLLADVVYSVKVGLPAEHIGKQMEAFLHTLDTYIDWRVMKLLAEAMAELRRDSKRSG